MMTSKRTALPRHSVSPLNGQPNYRLHDALSVDLPSTDPMDTAHESGRPDAKLDRTTPAQSGPPAVLVPKGHSLPWVKNLLALIAAAAAGYGGAMLMSEFSSGQVRLTQPGANPAAVQTSLSVPLDDNVSNSSAIHGVSLLAPNTSAVPPDTATPAPAMPQASRLVSLAVAAETDTPLGAEKGNEPTLTPSTGTGNEPIKKALVTDSRGELPPDQPVNAPLVQTQQSWLSTPDDPACPGALAAMQLCGIGVRK